MVNIGVGPSNAKTITDHIAVLRPHAWLMLGHCAGLRNSQQLGDYVLAHGYVREDHVLDEELPRCAEAGVGIVGGAIFASGILASGPVPGATYKYEHASPEILEKTRRIEAICQRHDTPLAAAAMQFPLAHPLFAAIIPGAIRAGQVEKNLQLLHHPIPAQLWAELKEEGLLAAHAPTPA